MAAKQTTDVRDNTWRENFNKRVTIPCLNPACSRFVTTTIAVATSTGKYCDECRKEARRLECKRFEDQHRAARNARRRKKTNGNV